VDNGRAAASSSAAIALIAAKSWGTEQGDYSPARFYVTSGEGGGQMRVRFGESIQGEIAALVQSGKLPDYRTAQDFVRDAVFHRLMFLRGLVDSGTLDKNLTAYAAQAKLDTLKRRGVDEKRYVETAREGLEEAAKVKDEAAMEEWVEAVEERLTADREMSPVAKAELARLIASYTDEGL
jgi:hypothetical protein